MTLSVGVSSPPASVNSRGKQRELLDPFELREPRVDGVDDGRVERADVGAVDERVRRGVGRWPLGVQSRGQRGEVGHEQDRGKVPRVAEEDGLTDERIGAERGLDRLRRDLLAAGRHQQFFLAIGDLEIAGLVEAPDVAGVKPAVVGSPRAVSSGRW